MLHVLFCIEELRAEFQALHPSDPERARRVHSVLDELVAELGLAPGVAAKPAADDLTLIRGIDAPLAATLAASALTRFSAIAAWTAADLAKLDIAGVTKARITEQNWIEQAAILAAGETTFYARQVQRGTVACFAPRPVAAAIAAPVAGSVTATRSKADVVVLATAAAKSAAAKSDAAKLDAAKLAATAVPATGATVIALDQRRPAKSSVVRTLRRTAAAMALGLVALALVGGRLPELVAARLPLSLEAAKGNAVQTGAHVPSRANVVAFDSDAQ